MKAFILVADAVSDHPDNTFSVLRGGVTEFSLACGEKGLELRAGVVVRISGDASDKGRHAFRLAVVGADGVEAAAGVAGRFELGPAGGVSQFASNVVIPLPSPGRYQFEAKVDDKTIDTWPLTVSAEGNQKK